jgi:serine/threonine-protein kinase RsbW
MNRLLKLHAVHILGRLVMRTSRTDSVPTMWADGLEQQDDWHVNCLSSVQEMAAVIEAVVTVMAELGYPPKDIFGARLTLEEAICNAIKHGHQHDPTKVIEVRYCIRAGHFLVEVQDQGPGFDPSKVRDATAPESLERTCGRGLLLMRHYAAWVRHNREGNCVTFCICPSEPLPTQQAAEPLLVAVRLSLCPTVP